MSEALRPGAIELLRTLPTASAIMDRSLCYLAVNQNWRDAYRLGDVPLVGRSHYEIFPEIGEEWKRVHMRCLEGETASRKADPFVRADGRTDFVDWTVAPWHSQDGTIAGLVMHTHVVTEQEHARTRLREDEAFIRTLFESSPIGMNLCQLDGRWLESNPAFLDIIGYSREEADGGMTYWELTPPEYNEAELQQLEALETTGRYGPYEKEFIRKDGSRIPVRLNGFMVNRKGEQFIWSLIEDLTEQRDLERNLERQRVQGIRSARLASIGEMAAGVAHEINNPLQIIDGYSYRIQKWLEKGEDVSPEAVDEIRNATRRASQIVRSMLKLAREDTGEAGIHSAAKIARESLSYTESRMKSHGVVLEHDIRSKRKVECSPIEMTQVLINLLNNAFDAVRQETGVVRLEVDDDDDEVVFRVIDNGPGVVAEIRDRLFDPFATTKPGGTGLGLSISNQIVESLGGTLSYERIGDCSHFVVRLPAQSKP